MRRLQKPRAPAVGRPTVAFAWESMLGKLGSKTGVCARFSGSRQEALPGFRKGSLRTTAWESHLERTLEGQSKAGVPYGTVKFTQHNTSHRHRHHATLAGNWC